MRGRCAALTAVLTAILNAAAPAAAEDAFLRQAREILKQFPLVDGHNDTPWLIRESAGGDIAKYDLRQRTPHETDLARLRAGQVGAQFWSVWIPSVDSGSARMQLEQIDLARRMIAAYPEALVFATQAADVAAAHRAGKIASFLGMENGRALENSLGALRVYYDLGVRYMTLTHGRNTDWADSATDEPKHAGLSPFGKEVVREMNRLGMLVDISHVSPAAMHQALDVSVAPVIFSHSSARAVTDHPRNVPDDVLRRLAQNGGVVMITFIPGFVSKKVMDWEGPLMEQLQGAVAIEDFARLEKEREKVAGPKPKATIQDVADHIDHAAKVAGVDHVGIGSDFAGVGMPEGLEDTSRYPYLFAELVKRGWKAADLQKLAGRNLVRAMAQAETVAARLSKERPASTATFEGLDGAAGADAAAAEKAVAELDTRYQDAVKRNDARTMDQILLDDFVLVVGSGKTYTKADLLKSAEARDTTYEKQDEEAGTQKVRVWGDTAVVTAKLWLKGTSDGKPFDRKLWFSDTYVRTKSGWRYAFGQASLSLPPEP